MAVSFSVKPMHVLYCELVSRYVVDACFNVEKTRGHGARLRGSGSALLRATTLTRSCDRVSLGRRQIWRAHDSRMNVQSQTYVLRLAMYTSYNFCWTLTMFESFIA